jgi:hypothetical protein
MSDLIVFGTGDVAQLADFYFANDSDKRVVAFTVGGAFPWQTDRAIRGALATAAQARSFSPMRADESVFSPGRTERSKVPSSRLRGI